MTFVSKPTTTETGRPRDYRNYIDGAFMPAPGEMIEVLNPATGVLLGRIPETDADLWGRFAQGARGDAVAGLAVIEDENALETAGHMLRSDEVFRDVAHHFLRHFDRLLNRRAQEDEPQVLAVLAETRSGRAFTLLAQVTGMLGSRHAMAAAN